MSVLFDQIEEKLNETRFFFKALELANEAHSKHVGALNRPFDTTGMPLARAFQYYLSAFLSANRSVRYYIIRVSRKVPNTASWRKAVNASLVLAALHHLRDVDIHDETLNMGVTVKIRNIPTPEISVSPLHFHSRGLAANRRLARQPNALLYLTSKPIIEIAREGLAELERVVAEGRSNGYLMPQPLAF